MEGVYQRRRWSGNADMRLERRLRDDVGCYFVEGEDMVMGSCCWGRLQEGKGEFVNMYCEGTDG